MAIFDGLEKLGLDGFGQEELFDGEKKGAQPAAAAAKVAAGKPAKLSYTEEKDFLFDKKYKCPICSTDFTCKTVRTGKVHPVKYDYDLRTVFDTVDKLKYQVITCPFCGYSVHEIYQGKQTDKQLKMVKEAISAKLKPLHFDGDIYTYDEAKLRYQLAIANAVARQARASEKAYLCLKAAWVIRGETEYMKASGDTPADKIEENEAAEKGLLKQALEGFIQARQNENYPIAEMDEKTVDYLLAALYYSQDMLQDCSRFLGSILVNPNIQPNLRHKAQDLKELLDAKKQA
ncbi:MAG: DUF2225 domain-containing protein [Lachnospiraceae bacterium]|nr:DUF2225 domain-containing protein [Lachnospiraceae bacterium]